MSASCSTPSPELKTILPDTSMGLGPPKALDRQLLQDADNTFSTAFELVHVMKMPSNGSDCTAREATQIALVSRSFVTDLSQDLELAKICSVEQMQEETEVSPSDDGLNLEVCILTANEAEDRPIHLGRNTLSSEISPDFLPPGIRNAPE